MIISYVNTNVCSGLLFYLEPLHSFATSDSQATLTVVPSALTSSFLFSSLHFSSYRHTPASHHVYHQCLPAADNLYGHAR